jgi:hypothetical protein
VLVEEGTYGSSSQPCCGRAEGRAGKPGSGTWRLTGD